MKKRLTIFVITLTTLFCLTGCSVWNANIRGNLTIEFRNDGRADVSVMVAFKDLSEESSDMLGDERIKQIANQRFKDWEYEPYEQDGFSGVSLIKKDVEILEIAGLLEELQEDDTDIASSFTLERVDENYVLDFKLYDKKNDIKTTMAISFLKAMCGEDSKIDYIVKLPNKAIDSNATSVSEDGKTLVWDLLSMEDTNMHVEFNYKPIVPDKQNEEPSSSNYQLLIGILVAVFFVIAVIVGVIVYKRKK